MRIAYVCADPGIPVFGRKGSTGHVQEVIRALMRCDGKVELFATRFDDETPPDLEAIPVHQIPPMPRAELAAREQRTYAANHE